VELLRRSIASLPGKGLKDAFVFQMSHVAREQQVRRPTLDYGYIFEQYMKIKHSLLYKPWTAGLRG